MGDVSERPAEGIDDVDLAAVEEAVQRALAQGGDAGLCVLGYGEISLVIGWPTEAPVVAAKRLPPFASQTAAARYESQYRSYVKVLAERGVDVVPSRFVTVHASSGPGVVAYVVQPVLASDDLGPAVLRVSEPDPEHPLITGIVDATLRVTDARTGLDAQISNWVLDGGHLSYLDVTTPLLFDPDGRPLMDTGIFLAALPWPLRSGVDRFVIPDLIGSYRDPRKVLVDVAANLLKERLPAWIPPVLHAANAVVSPAIEPGEVDTYYRSDARTWALMLRVRRADRWWQRNVRRRPYPFVLPGPILR